MSAKATAWIMNGPAYVDHEDLEGRRKKRKLPRPVRVKRARG